MVDNRSLKVGCTTAAASFGTRGERTTFQPTFQVSLSQLALRMGKNAPSG
jgi:hypothetical protein